MPDESTTIPIHKIPLNVDDYNAEQYFDDGEGAEEDDGDGGGGGEYS